MSKNTRSLLTFLILIVGSTVLLSTIQIDDTSTETTINQIASDIKSGAITKVIVEDNTVTAEYGDDETKEAKKEPNDSLPALLETYGVTAEELTAVEYEYREPSLFALFLMNSLPFLLIIGLSVFSLWYILKQAQGANNKAMMFGQTGAREFTASDKKKATFKDIAGNVEAKVELEEVVDFLKAPKKFKDLGARIPRGVLLFGPPGTGKTLLSRAVAGEANVPFFHLSGSEFVEMFVGVGASRVRDLFKKAKKQAPAIVFIDEIDAVGRQRGTGVGGSHDEREQTLNQILVEMDGFDNDTNVIVIAATNRPDVLDPALLRPGRFDRQVTLDLPDITDREEILKVHAVGKKFDKDVNFRIIAERTAGFSGADLANVLNEAAILAGRKNLKSISYDLCLESIEKVILGPERKSRVFSDEEKKIVAYHEAGHAIVSHFHPNTDPVHKVSIISRGRAGGYTMSVPSQDKHLKKKSEYEAELAVLLGGYMAEQTVFGEVTTGPSSDLKRATSIAKSIITQYGMSDELGTRTYGEHEDMIFLGKHIHENRDYSESVAEKIDSEVLRVLKEAQRRVMDIITEHKKQLEAVANTLLEKETIEKEEFEQLMQTA